MRSSVYAKRRAEMRTNIVKALEFVDQKQFDKAIEEFNKEVEAARTILKLTAIAGQHIARRESCSCRRRCFTKMIELSPKSEVGYVERGQLSWLKSSTMRRSMI